ncbi:MAG: FtsW/RodA/SpoVE family cell cycle protein [Ferrimicrobium sp.]
MARVQEVNKAADRRRRELELIILANLVTVFAWVLALYGTDQTAKLSLQWPLVVVIGLPLLAHIVNRRFIPSADAIILPIVALLNGLGYVMINRLDPAQGTLQAIWTAIAVGAYTATIFAIRNPEALDRYRYLLAFAGIGFLFLPLVPGIGVDINGARLWIHLGPLSFQPVEVAKLLLAIFLASLITERKDLLARLREGGIRRIGPLAGAFALALAIMAVERDVGFALLIFCTFVIVMWVGTANRTYLVLGVILFGVGAVVAGAILPQVHERIAIWLNPWQFPHTYGYQLIQAQYALGTGGLTGTGLGMGHVYIPVRTSDFIFAVFGEEMGLLGSSAIVMAFVLLIGAGMRIALRARSEFSSLLAMTFTIILGLQTFFILAGIIRLLPLTGVTLPFVAYGGSSLLANYVLIALLMRISHQSNRQLDQSSSDSTVASE